MLIILFIHKISNNKNEMVCILLKTITNNLSFIIAWCLMRGTPHRHFAGAECNVFWSKIVAKIIYIYSNRQYSS